MLYRPLRSLLAAATLALAPLALGACADDAPDPSCSPPCAGAPITGAAAGNQAPIANAGSAAPGSSVRPGGSGGTGAPPAIGGAGNGGGGSGGTLSPVAGTAGPTLDAGAGGMGASGTGGVAGNLATAGSSSPSQALPPIDDYGDRGPFETTTVNNTGPDGQYTMFRPRTVGDEGFLHPIATWGNGITTTPALYDALLNTIASHGFVIIASNSTGVTAQMMTDGLDWLIAQNGAAGDLMGKLDVMRAASIGYSLGGGAAVTTGKHPNVIVTVSMHGLTGASGALHGPLLLFTSTGDTFVSAAQFVDPTFRMSAVQTFYGTLTGGSHLTPLGDAADERAPMVAWLRLWVYGDEAAKKYFYGDDCLLCSAPWTNPQRKNWP
jgi:hypothetical protein